MQKKTKKKKKEKYSWHATTDFHFPFYKFFFLLYRSQPSSHTLFTQWTIAIVVSFCVIRYQVISSPSGTWLGIFVYENHDFLGHKHLNIVEIDFYFFSRIIKISENDNCSTWVTHNYSVSASLLWLMNYTKSNFIQTTHSNFGFGLLRKGKSISTFVLN